MILNNGTSLDFSVQGIGSAYDCAEYCQNNMEYSYYEYGAVGYNQTAADRHEPWTTCYCGKSYNLAHATVAHYTECNKPCYNDIGTSDTYKCGGINRVTVFSNRDFDAIGFPLPKGWYAKYPGCHVDSTTSRLLSNHTMKTLANNTPETCMLYCAGIHKNHAGVEYGNECHCGDGFAYNPVGANIWDCNMPCAGDNNQVCGGANRIFLMGPNNL
jgi:hypothetical protein